MSKPDLVIFDLDNTILNGDSDYTMINYLVDIGILDEAAKSRNEKYIQDYQEGKLNFDEYTDFALQAYVGKTLEAVSYTHLTLPTILLV